MNQFDRDNYQNWKWGVIYNNPNDPAIWVPKRTGLGWTLNFAHTRAYVYLLLLISIPMLISLFTTGVLKF
jgi:uncharacterized membrane protein